MSGRYRGHCLETLNGKHGLFLCELGMCSPQSSNMDDVIRLLHPVHQDCAVVLQDTQEFEFLLWKD